MNVNATPSPSLGRKLRLSLFFSISGLSNFSLGLILPLLLDDQSCSSESVGGFPPFPFPPFRSPMSSLRRKPYRQVLTQRFFFSPDLATLFSLAKMEFAPPPLALVKAFLLPFLELFHLLFFPREDPLGRRRAFPSQALVLLLPIFLLYFY